MDVTIPLWAGLVLLGLGVFIGANVGAWIVGLCVAASKPHEVPHG